MTSNSQGKGLVGGGGWLLTHVGAAVVLLSVLLKVVPGYATVFADLAVELPVLTQAVIGLSRWTSAYWWLIVPLGCVDAGILLGLRNLSAGARWLSTLWAVLVLLAAMLLAGVAVLAVAVPFSDLVQSLR